MMEISVSEPAAWRVFRFTLTVPPRAASARNSTEPTSGPTARRYSQVSGENAGSSVPAEGSSAVRRASSERAGEVSSHSAEEQSGASGLPEKSQMSSASARRKAEPAAPLLT